MGTFVDKANHLFGHVHWTGESSIHVSLYREGELPSWANSQKTILSLVAKANLGFAIWRILQKKFGNMEWLINENQFNTLFLVDVFRHVNQMGDTANHTKLRNPSTGNVFHRMALLGNVVGGIRFWVEERSDPTGLSVNSYALGWRFRIENIAPAEDEETRIRAREIIEESEGMIEMVMDSFMEVAEPPKEPMVEVHQMEAVWEVA